MNTRSKTYRILLLLLVLLPLVLLTSGCIPGDGKASTGNPAGFLWGIWHGWVAPISLIIGIFKHNIRVYEVLNTGWWYDLGFYLAVVGGFGGLSFARRRGAKYRRKDRDDE